MRPDLPYARLPAALRLRPRRALSSTEAKSFAVPHRREQHNYLSVGVIIPVLRHHDNFVWRMETRTIPNVASQSALGRIFPGLLLPENRWTLASPSLALADELGG